MKYLILASALTLFAFDGICQQGGTQEILTVEIFGPAEWQGAKFHGIFIHREDQDTEKVDFGPCNDGADCIRRYGPIVRSKLQELINDGWELRSSAGGDSFIRYIFFRLKK